MTKIYVLPKETDAYGFAKQKAAEKYNIDFTEVTLARGSHGKPYFKNLPDFHFNISHSGEVKVVAVSDSNVGVDVEKLRTPDLRVTKRFCTDERAYIAKDDSPARFFEVWTKKEAYLKSKGTGLLGGLQSFSIFKTDLPVKTFTFGEYIISVCGEGEFELIILTKGL